MSGHRSHNLERRISVVLLVLLVGLSAWAYGSVEAGASEWLLFGAMLVAVPMVWSSSPGRTPAVRLAIPLALFVIWGFVQSAPLPKGLLRALSPATARIYEETVPPGGGESLPAWLLERAQKEGVRLGDDRETPDPVPDRGDPALGRSLSIHPAATRSAALGWVSPVLLILTAAWVSQDRASRYRLLWGLAGWAAVWGLVGFLVARGWDGRPIWSREVPPEELLRIGRPFINPNHYAAAVAMGTLIAIGLVLALLSRASGRLDRRGIRVALMDRGWTLPRVIGAVLAAVLGVVGIALSLSRGGMLSFAAGVGFLVAARWLRGWLVVPVVAVVVVAILAGLPTLGASDGHAFGTAPFVSAESDGSALLRMDVWGKTMRMFLDHPLAGTGIGTFEWAFTGYQRQGEYMIFREAHNDFLQALAEGGIVGALLLSWALWIFAARILLPVLRRTATELRWTTVATAAAIFAVLAHSLLDFNLQIPANAAQFSILVGILAAASKDGSGERATEEGP